MLLSMLFSLTPQRPEVILSSLGRPLQAWLLRQVTSRRPDLGQRLHDQTDAKPFTVSTIIDGRGRIIQPGTRLLAGGEYWFRVTSFNAELTELLQDYLVDARKHLPRTLEIYKMRFHINGCTVNPAQHPWAGQSTFQDLCSEDADTHQIQLEFASPTAFRSQGADIPLPIPAHVFRSYWLKWNAFAPEALAIHEFWPNFAADCIQVSELSGINSVKWKFAEGTRGAATGYTGMVAFTLLPQNKCGEWRPFWPGADGVMNTLARFAFYCGTGHHTTIGMGQTRLVPDFNARSNHSGSVRASRKVH
jgi:CRISPR-associated endoribonuclease Cas6